ncbi:arylsulfatase [Dyadobacter subterraneus]|uniref:Arylsulfatase n=1 Tax=Dyadobacter subterraneus TaxID=2773304 RepID=A0ABR9W7H0_9BACT|nr:arylsulfatase [Dyadobacter subterraneus]MBE9461412.1 arylsulfatase [Dyadobacter subterraneus]
MFRKLFLLFSFTFATLQLFAQSKLPNIIFILADDLGYGDLQCYGQKLIQTPNIDRLAQEGLRFTNFYAGAPVCSPSRSVLMTGLNTGHTTIRGNATKKGGLAGSKGKETVYRANLTAEDVTIGNVMQQSGYTTAMFGKWHLDGYDTLATPLQRGFDEFSGWLISYPATYRDGYWPDRRFKNGKLVDVNKNKNGQKEYYSSDICTDEAEEFLSRQKGATKPFMLMVNYNNPHSPLDAPDLAIYKDKDWPENMKTYASMIYQLDQSVGRLQKYLIDNGLDKNTIVFFCSDNGPRSEPTKQLTEVADFFDSNGLLKGYKRDLYEGGIRVPMIAWAPGIIKASTVSDVPAYFADILPTFAGIAKSKKNYKTDGINISQILTGGKPDSKPRFLYWEFFENGFEQAVRYGKWKAVKHAGKTELYDLEKDPGEAHNIAAENQAIVTTIEKYLTTARTESEFWPVD